MRNALAHAEETSRRVVSAFIVTALISDDASAHARWRAVADQLRPGLPTLSAFMDEDKNNALA